MRGLVILILVIVSANSRAASDFGLVDANNKPHSLAEYQGRPLILHFWATWCHYCERVQPTLDAIYQHYRHAGLQVLGVSYQEPRDQALAAPALALQQRGISFPTLLKGELAAINYAVAGTPTTFFIDAKGRVVAKTHSSRPQDPRLWQYSRQILAQ